jgi:recombinational DNA repair protein (RecF pathway)
MIDIEVYRALLVRMMPKVIESEDEYQDALYNLETLENKEPTPEELLMAYLLALLIQEYEEEYLKNLVTD